MLKLTASQFIRVMSHGRTKPILVLCSDSQRNMCETVLKLRAGNELGEKGHAFEIIASLLALDLGLKAAEPAIVMVPNGFELIIPAAYPEIRNLVRNSNGENFGAKHFGQDLAPVPRDIPLRGDMRDRAAAVFMFDTLLQNVDRRVNNHNMFVRGGDFLLYDHEQSFSFAAVPIIGGAPKPWDLNALQQSFEFLKSHALYRELKGSTFALESFTKGLQSLSDSQIAAYGRAIPAAWASTSSAVGQVLDYLQEARDKAEKLLGFVKHALQ